MNDSIIITRDEDNLNKDIPEIFESHLKTLGYKILDIIDADYIEKDCNNKNIE